MIINRIKRHIYDDYTLCGKHFSEIQDKFINGINDIEKISEAVSDDELICLIYDDTPLTDNETLSSLSRKVLEEKKCYSVGNGFISVKGHNDTVIDPKLKTTTQFTPSLYGDFLKEIRKRIITKHLNNGVIIYDPDTVFIDFDVTLCSGSKLFPFTVLEGNTYVGKNSIIYENSHLCDSRIGDSVTIKSSYVFHSVVEDMTTVGPFAYIRNNSYISASCRIGDFVEIKSAHLGKGVKCAHLSYIGDAEVGNHTNVGCGTVFCNYDGTKKNRTTVGSDVFIGANTNLIAPVTIGNNSFIAAGSTVTSSVPENSFVIARSRQTTK